ncbi:MAG: DUF5946 family protein [Nakamurella sp.]
MTNRPHPSLRRRRPLRSPTPAAHHTLNVACYALQHPSEYDISGAPAQIRFLMTFLDRLDDRHAGRAHQGIPERAMIAVCDT